MADYSFGSLSFVYGTGSTFAADYVGRPQGFRTSIARLPLTLNAACKVSSISFGGATANLGTVTYLCRINKSSTDSTASGTVGTVTFGTNTVNVSFNTALDAGNYYVWFYFSGSSYGYVGSNSIPFAFNSAVIKKSSISIYMKTSSTQAKATDELYLKTSSTASKKATNFYIKTGNSSYKEIK